MRPSRRERDLAEIEDGDALLEGGAGGADRDMIGEARLHRIGAGAVGRRAAGPRQPEPGGEIVVEHGHLGGGIEQGRGAVGR